MPFAGGWMSVGKQLGLLLIVWQKMDLFIRCAEVGLSSTRKSHFPTIWILEHNRRRSVWFSRGGIGVQTRLWSKEFAAIMRSLCGWYRSFWKVCQSVQPLYAVTVWFTAWCGKHFRSWESRFPKIILWSALTIPRMTARRKGLSVRYIPDMKWEFRQQNVWWKCFLIKTVEIQENQGSCLLRFIMEILFVKRILVRAINIMYLF